MQRCSDELLHGADGEGGLRNETRPFLPIARPSATNGPGPSPTLAGKILIVALLVMFSVAMVILRRPQGAGRDHGCGGGPNVVGAVRGCCKALARRAEGVPAGNHHPHGPANQGQVFPCLPPDHHFYGGKLAAWAVIPFRCGRGAGRMSMFSACCIFFAILVDGSLTGRGDEAGWASNSKYPFFLGDGAPRRR